MVVDMNGEILNAGWEKRAGWTYKTPYGENPDSELEPAVHISRFEADGLL